MYKIIYRKNLGCERYIILCCPLKSMFIKSIKGLLNNKGGGQGPGASFSDQLLELVSQPGFLGLGSPRVFLSLSSSLPFLLSALYFNFRLNLNLERGDSPGLLT